MPEGVTVAVGFAGVIIAAMLGVGGKFVVAGTKKGPAGQATKRWGVVLIAAALLAAFAISMVVIGMSVAQNTEDDVELAGPTWLSAEVKNLDDSTILWNDCPDESSSQCVWWNAYSDGDGEYVALEILRCAQDGAWIDETGVEHIGLPVGQYERVSGITARRCP